MFTGIISSKGQVKSLQRKEELILLTLALEPQERPFSAGESIAVNGVCLTLTSFTGNTVVFDLSAETINRSTLGQLLPLDWVNTERSLTLGASLGGHWVLGHADGVGKVTQIDRKGGNLFLHFWAPAEVQEYVVFKGSIAVDGVSLTIAEAKADGFGVTIVPHTAEETTLGSKRVGDRVNLEADIIGKYVKKFLMNKDVERKEITPEFLKAHGFL
jgi:riboflavin synthase